MLLLTCECTHDGDMVGLITTATELGKKTVYNPMPDEEAKKIDDDGVSATATAPPVAFVRCPKTIIFENFLFLVDVFNNFL